MSLLLAQAAKGIEELRQGAAKWDSALAAAFVSAIEQPFPELVPFGQGCSCVFGPRCESNRCCEDKSATMGVKDRRTGTIRARARWSFFHPFSRGPVPRLLFYCKDCFASLKENWSKSIRGLHPPQAASDFWQPSLTDMVRLVDLEIRRQERATRAQPENATDRQYENERMRRWTPAQRSQAEFVRRQMRHD